MRTFPLVSLEKVMDGSTQAQYTFGAPTYFRGARAQGSTEYWQSGSYGIVTVTDGLGQSYLWVQSTIHDGPGAEDGDIFLSYTQIEDPDNAGYYESFTCQVAYRRSATHADLNNVSVRNYYGEGLFADPKDTNVGANTATTSFIDINYQGLMYDNYSVWKLDQVNPLDSYKSSYDY